MLFVPDRRGDSLGEKRAYRVRLRTGAVIAMLLASACTSETVQSLPIRTPTPTLRPTPYVVLNTFEVGDWESEKFVFDGRRIDLSVIWQFNGPSSYCQFGIFLNRDAPSSGVPETLVELWGWALTDTMDPVPATPQPHAGVEHITLQYTGSDSRYWVRIATCPEASYLIKVRRDS